MNRRELLKSLAPLAMIPVAFKGKEVGKAILIDPNRKYIVFLDREMVDLESFCRYESALPAGTPVHSVYVPRDKTIDEAITLAMKERERRSRGG